MPARKTRAKKTANAKGGTAANVGYEAQLWQMADALRGSMDAAEYKCAVSRASWSRRFATT
jgi:type I restriction enzyme M protein